MSLILKVIVLTYTLSFIQAHTHDKISKCSLTRVHKSRQTIIESPNYPNNYKPDSCWDYVIRSPYKCPTKFHIQFLDFDLEFSENCKNDYFAIGLENVDGDMDVLCGQVVGIKKYHTPDGVLRLRFFAGESPWPTGRGFKLLVTRLACEREEIFGKFDEHADDNVHDDDDTVAVTAPSEYFQPPELELMQIFQTLTRQEQYQNATVPPSNSLSYSTQLPSPPYPATGMLFPTSAVEQPPVYNGPNNFQPPCKHYNGLRGLSPNIANYYEPLQGNQFGSYSSSLGEYTQANYLPFLAGLNHFNQLQLQQAANSGFSSSARNQHIGFRSSFPLLLRAQDSTTDSLELCCLSAFQQKRFYLSSPGFPRTIFSNILPNMQKRDCVFRVQKSSSNVCRLRFDLKFFDFGQSYQGTIINLQNIGQTAIHNMQKWCEEDYIEIDNQRFCGCRSGLTFTAYWPTVTDKKLRMRMGNSNLPLGGFLIEIVQEECSETYLDFMITEKPIGLPLNTLGPNLINNQLLSPQQDQQILLAQQKTNLNGNLNSSQKPQHQSEDMNSISYLFNNPFNTPTAHQIANVPNTLPNHLQQQNLLTQQQVEFMQNSNLFPATLKKSFASNDLHHNLFQPQSWVTNPFGGSQIRYTRSYSEKKQPLTIVETNSIRKEYHYPDNDSLNHNEDSSQLTGSSSTETSSKWDRKDANVNVRKKIIGTVDQQRMKCTFEMSDLLRLSVDILWITKPICYAPQKT